MRRNRELICSIMLLIVAMSLIMVYRVCDFSSSAEMRKENDENNYFSPNMASQGTLIVQPCGAAGSGKGQGPNRT